MKASFWDRIISHLCSFHFAVLSPSPAHAHTNCSQTYDLAGTRNPSTGNIKQLLQDLKRQFPLVMVADRLHESIIMLRRQYCFDRLDAITLQPPSQPPVEVNFGLKQQILNYNRADAELHAFFSAQLTATINKELYWGEEIAELEEWNEEAADMCKEV
jgi:hypothetical protein